MPYYPISYQERCKSAVSGKARYLIEPSLQLWTPTFLWNCGREKVSEINLHMPPGKAMHQLQELLANQLSG
jgi:hypothetical protein